MLQSAPRLVCFFCASLVVVLATVPTSAGAAETDWPAVADPATKAWTRWWWHGNAVTHEDLTAVMEEYAAAGIGGLEITPIYGVRGEEEDFIEYLTPQWMDMFEHTLREAERLGMQIDMSTGTGWPFGGPWVEADTACRNLVLQTYDLDHDTDMLNLVRQTQRPMVRAIGRRVAIGDLKESISQNDDLQGLALEQVRWAKPLPLLTAVAYGPNDQRVDLTDRIDAKGSVNWIVPDDGEWTLYAVFLGWHGKMVERAGPGGEGNVIDHFSRAALDAYLKKFDEAIGDRDIGSFRAFFNDSYEVDDAAGNADATPRILEEFAKRRGYDLRDHLPALFGKASADENARVLCDYRETISDLLLDEFTKPWTEWAHKHDAITRNQAHGSPANLLDLYAASDIPETEATDRIQFISAASAAHVTGKKLVSAEAATWLNEHFLGTLAETKTWVDRYFLGGVNHICYHGTCYSPPGDPWPGRLFYASVELQPTSSFWPHFHALNSYVARCQSFLQAGAPDSDVLIYYPIHDEWARRGRTPLAHFNGEARGSTARRVGEQLLAGGYLFDFISDRQLQTVGVADEFVAPPGGLQTRALVIPPCDAMPIESLRKLAELADGGARIVLPADDWSPEPAGLRDLDARRAEAKELVARIRQGRGVQSAPAETTQAQLLGGVIVPETMSARGLSFIRRRFDDGHAYFIVNAGDQRFDDWVDLRKAASAVIFDPASGEAGAALGAPGPENVRFRLQLEPGQSCIVRTYGRPARGPVYPYFIKADGDPAPLPGPWKITFVDGGPKLPDAIDAAELKSWTEFEGDDVDNFSGIGRYASELKKPAGAADAWLLDLGEVHESAEVKLNGESFGTLFSEPYRVRIPAAKLRDTNTLEISVANLMANRIAELDRRGVPWKKFYNVNFAPRRPENRGAGGVFDASRWKPLPSGLVGPVTLTPVTAATPAAAR